MAYGQKLPTVLSGLGVEHRAEAAGEPIHRLAFAMGAVTGRAFLVVDRAAFIDPAMAGRQARAVRRDVDVPARDLLRRRRAADAIGLAGRGGGGKRDSHEGGRKHGQ